MKSAALIDWTAVKGVGIARPTVDEEELTRKRVLVAILEAMKLSTNKWKQMRDSELVKARARIVELENIISNLTSSEVI